MKSIPRALVALLWVALPVTADEMPARKPGLWEVKMAGAGLPPAATGTMKQCIDAATDRAAMSGALAAGSCQQGAITKTTTGWAFESTCQVAGMTTMSKSVVSGDFTSNIKVAVTSTVSGTGSAAREMRFTVESRYVGACEAGQKPGDVILPNGKVMQMPAVPQQQE